MQKLQEQMTNCCSISNGLNTLEFEIKVETLCSKYVIMIVKLRGLIELICTGLWNGDTANKERKSKLWMW